MRNFAAEFKSAFYAIGLMLRLAEPTQKISFSTHVDRINDSLRKRGHMEVEGDVIMAAVIAWNDSDYRLQGSRYGQVAEVALDPWRGRAPSDSWRRLLLTAEPCARCRRETSFDKSASRCARSRQSIKRTPTA
jgi:hypothetical protein